MLTPGTPTFCIAASSVNAASSPSRPVCGPSIADLIASELVCAASQADSTTTATNPPITRRILAPRRILEYPATVMTVRMLLLIAVTVALAPSSAGAQAGQSSAAVEAETMKHFQALLRLDTSNPPGNEVIAVEYLKGVLDAEGIAAQVFASDPKRPNLVARIKGSGKKRPLLVMGHTD